MNKGNRNLIVGSSSLGIIFLLLLIIVGNVSGGSSITDVLEDEGIIEFTDTVTQAIKTSVDEAGIGDAITGIVSVPANSLIDEPLLIPETNQNAIDQFLDEVEPLGISSTPKIGVAVDAVLIDSNFQKVEIPSNFLNIPTSVLPLTLLDEEGRLFDLGSVTAGFTAIGNTEEPIDIKGKFKILLNDRLVAEQEFFGQGTPDENKQLRLQVTGEKDAVTFVFADEPESQFKATGKFENNYEIIITHVNAVVGTDFDTQQYIWSGDFPAYTLRLLFDEEKIVIRNNYGVAISVFKSDSTFSLCGSWLYIHPASYWNGFKVVSGGNPYYSESNPPPVDVYIEGEFKASAKHKVGYAHNSNKGGASCGGHIKIPRDANVTFVVNPNTSNEESFEIKTPTSQHNYSINCKPRTDCSSNFGWLP